MTSPDPNYPAGAQYGLLGGFLLQTNGNVMGQALYSVAFDELQNGLPVVCNSGSATITGTISGQAVTLTAVAGPQTFQLTGTLGPNGSVTGGQFTTAGGGSVSGSVCGAPTTQGTSPAWAAVNIPVLSGSLAGSFHSNALSPHQDFQVTGFVSQGGNIGSSSSTITGSLSFIDPTTLVSDYSCFPTGQVNVNGQVSGNTVVLQLIGTDGSNDGFITVNLDSTTNGYYLHSPRLGYQITSKSCGTDQGYVCLGLNNTTACQQPIALSPAAVTFSPQLLVCTTQNCSPDAQGTPTTQTITLTNNQPPGSPPLTGLTLQFSPFGGQTDFTNVPNYSESDNCATFLGSSTSGQSCSITIAFAPQESCSWLPPPGGVAAGCPMALNATLTVQSPVSTDNDLLFAVPITGKGLSSLQSSVSEVDFSAEAVGEAAPPQLISFTNQSAYPVQILGPQTQPCTFSTAPKLLPRPLVSNGVVGGLQVVTNNVSLVSGPPQTVDYNCDADQKTGLPNFIISSDTCTGALLGPQGTCSLELGFSPQPFYNELGFGFDYYLQLNTVQCFSQSGGVGSACEIDGGRFPVEVRANPFSPLRLLPSAGLNFGGVPVGKSSAIQTINLYNDPADPNSATVNLIARIAASGGYSETDNCPFNLAPGATCTINVKFKPSATGFNSGTLSIFYTLGSAGTTGNTQFVYLRGIGQ